MRGGGVLGPTDHPFPEARQRSLGGISRRVDRLLASLLGHFEKQGCLANLPGPGEQLNAAWCRLGEPLG